MGLTLVRKNGNKLFLYDFKQTAITFQLKVNTENKNEAKQFF